MAVIIFDGQIRQSAVEGLEKTIQEFTGLHDKYLFDKDEEYIDAVGLSQLLISWRFLEKMDFLLQDLQRALDN